MVRLCESFLGDGQVLEKVVYFTASPLNPNKSSRQSAFLNANALLNGSRFEVVRGKYIDKQIVCPVCKGSIARPEEKKTDVNISVRMIADCIQDLTDVVVLVSADSDLIPPIEFIQGYFPQKRVKVYFPPTNFSHDLDETIRRYRSKPVLMIKNESRFAAAIMDDVVSSGGKSFYIPPKWKGWQ